MYPAGTSPLVTSANALGMPNDRPLFDFVNLPYPHLIPYPQYTFKEACVASGFLPDKLRAELRSGIYGSINPYPSQRVRRHRKNYVTIMVPYGTLVALMRDLPETIAAFKAAWLARQ